MHQLLFVNDADRYRQPGADRLQDMNSCRQDQNMLFHVDELIRENSRN